MKNKIRIGVLVNDKSLSKWAYFMLKQIHNSAYAEIVLIVENNSKKSKKRKKSIFNYFSTFLYVLYRKIDYFFFKSKSSLFARKKIDFLDHIDLLKVTAKESKFRDEILDSDINQIKNYNVDIFIRLGFRILTGKILVLPKYGVWSYHHANNTVNRGGPPGFWEVFNFENTTGITLQILSESLDAGKIITKSFSQTINYSVTKNLENYYADSIKIIPNKIEELFNVGEAAFFENIKNNAIPEFYYNPLYVVPKNKDVLFSFFKILIKYFYEKIKNQFVVNQWILLFKIDKKKYFSTDIYNFKEIIPPSDRFWADPHVLYKNNKYYIFIEELIYKQNKGFISLIEMNSNGEYKKPQKIIEEDYHLSYPFLIEENNELYMVPESKQIGKIVLYKCLEFPNEWKQEIILINDLKAVDSTIVFYNNLYWLFTVVSNDLNIFYSEKLVSNDWKSHKKNPVVSDVRSSRPAGKIFEFNNFLYRPSQNSEIHYGRSININKILVLNENDYKEKKVSEIHPNWLNKVVSTHTINFSNGITILDAQKKIIKLLNKKI